MSEMDHGGKEQDAASSCGIKESEITLDEGKRSDGWEEAGGKTSSLGAAHVGRVALSDDQKLLHRAVGHVYSKIIQPEEEGGWSGWFERNCKEFDVEKRDRSQVGRTHKLVYTRLHREYEGMVESALAEFVSKEGIDNSQDLYMRIYNAQEEMADTVNLLLAAADYKKFVGLMKRRRKKQLKTGSAPMVAVAKKDLAQVEAVSMASAALSGDTTMRSLRK